MAKILAAGDLHGDSGAAIHLAERAKAENVDIVVLCGDVVNANIECKGLLKPFIDAGKKVILIPGNHDGFATADFLAELYGACNLHGYSLICNDVGLFGCGGANIGIEALSEEEILNLLRKGFERVCDMKKKVMVTHVFPSGTLMEKLSHSSVPGSSGVREALEEFRPDVLFCSHSHEAEGVEDRIGGTRIISVGRKGRVVEL